MSVGTATAPASITVYGTTDTNKLKVKNCTIEFKDDDSKNYPEHRLHFDKGLTVTGHGINIAEGGLRIRKLGMIVDSGPV
jgi:hypothetical protein